jgi:hypothetical protein
MSDTEGAKAKSGWTDKERVRLPHLPLHLPTYLPTYLPTNPCLS